LTQFLDVVENPTDNIKTILLLGGSHKFTFTTKCDLYNAIKIGQVET